MTEKLKTQIKSFLSDNVVPNPLLFTLTAKQRVNGQAIDSIHLSRNFRHFMNRLNKRVFGNAHLRFGKKLKLFVVTEVSLEGRYHLHGIMEKPAHISKDVFEDLMAFIWTKQTKWGYEQIHLEIPNNERGAVQGWMNYCLKERCKVGDFASSVDWENINFQ